MGSLLDVQTIEDIAVGAAILGTGGGGDPYIGKLMAQQAANEYGPARLIDLDDVPDQEWIVPVAMMGAPTVIVEKIPSGDEALKAFQALERYLGAKAYATMSIEAGGINSTIPIAVAAALDLPLVDADGMGRAFPEIQMVTPTLYGISATPMVMVDEKGNSLILNTISNRWTEKLSRAATVQMGGSAIIALYAMKGWQAKEALVKGSISLEAMLGRAVRLAHQEKRDPIEAILSTARGFKLFEGKISDVERKTEKGFARGEAQIEGIEKYKNRALKIHFQNENLVAVLDGSAVATVPDLISILDKESGLPITTEGLKYGSRVVVIGIPCSEKWRSEEGIKLVGPRYFGYDLDYIPIEARAEAMRRWIAE